MASAVSYTGEGVSLTPGAGVSIPAHGVSWQADVSLLGNVSVQSSGPAVRIALEGGGGFWQRENGAGLWQWG